MELILASKSPRRQELLKLLGLPFRVVTADVDETMDPRLPAGQEVARVSRKKAAAVAGRAGEEAVIIAADTVVVIGGDVLGKPHSEQEAAGMLRRLSGREHEVLTALSVQKGSRVQSELVSTRVRFRALCEGEIAAYIRTGEPMDKAGSYGIQGYGAVFVEGLMGDYFSVMGLPLCPLCRMLRACGVTVLGEA